MRRQHSLGKLREREREKESREEERERKRERGRAGGREGEREEGGREREREKVFCTYMYLKHIAHIGGTFLVEVHVSVSKYRRKINEDGFKVHGSRRMSVRGYFISPSNGRTLPQTCCHAGA